MIRNSLLVLRSLKNIKLTLIKFSRVILGHFHLMLKWFRYRPIPLFLKHNHVFTQGHVKKFMKFPLEKSSRTRFFTRIFQHTNHIDSLALHYFDKKLLKCLRKGMRKIPITEIMMHDSCNRNIRWVTFTKKKYRNNLINSEKLWKKWSLNMNQVYSPFIRVRNSTSLRGVRSFYTVLLHKKI